MPTTVTLGPILTQTGWQLTARIKTPEGRALYEKLQYLVNAIGVSNPVAFRITTGGKALLNYWSTYSAQCGHGSVALTTSCRSTQWRLTEISERGYRYIHGPSNCHQGQVQHGMTSYSCRFGTLLRHTITAANTATASTNTSSCSSTP
eukprot:5528058-Amphidinium_carterae.2